MNVSILRRFVGNPDVWAAQLEDGSYAPHREPVTDAALQAHLDGETAGTYVNRGNKARFVVFDVDTGDDASEQATAVAAACGEMGVKDAYMGVEFSGRKGYHIWVLVGEWREARELRRFGRAVCTLADVQCEVFPKQDDVRDLGSLVKLPFGKHRVSGMASEWRTAVPYEMPAGVWERDVVPHLPQELAGRKSFAGQAAERFPCLDIIQSCGVQEGSRNNQLFHLATMLRRAGVASEYVASIVSDVNEKGDPLDPFELEQLLQSAEQSGPVCDQLPVDRQCGELCIRARTKGLYTRPRQLRHAQPGEKVVIEVGSREGNVVTFEHEDLQTGKGVLS